LWHVSIIIRVAKNHEGEFGISSTTNEVWGGDCAIPQKKSSNFPFEINCYGSISILLTAHLNSKPPKAIATITYEQILESQQSTTLESV